MHLTNYHFKHSWFIIIDLSIIELSVIVLN